MPKQAGAKTEQWLSFVENMTRELGTAARPLLLSPVFQIVGAVSLIEWLQRQYVGTGVYGWVSQPGTHARRWAEIETPLISQPLATTMESVIISTEALKNVGGLLGDLLPLLLKK